jgi:hypothetical protein
MLLLKNACDPGVVEEQADWPQKNTKNAKEKRCRGIGFKLSDGRRDKLALGAE